MANVNFYSTTKKHANELVKTFRGHCLLSKIIDTGDTKTRAGHARYKIVVLNPGLDDKEFEQKCLRILSKK